MLEPPSYAGYLDLTPIKLPNISRFISSRYWMLFLRHSAVKIDVAKIDVFQN